MVYNKQSWVNEPSVLTPVSADRLAHMETQYDEAVAADVVLRESLVGAAPDGLNTVGKLAAALAGDPAFAATVAAALAGKAPLASPSFTGTVSGVSKAMVGLGSVDNTSDLSKPVSTATQSALDAKAADSGLTRGKAGTNYKVVACVLRWVSATTWEFLNDAGHAPTGVASVVRMTSPFRLRVNFDFTATKVGTFTTTSDDAFAKADLRVGPSVGTTFADLHFFLGASGTAEVDPGLLTTAGGNIWVYGLFEVA